MLTIAAPAIITSTKSGKRNDSPGSLTRAGRAGTRRTRKFVGMNALTTNAAKRLRSAEGAGG